MTMGEKILKLRKARLWNQEDLAEQIGVTRQAVSRWESDSAKPDADKVIALCDLFGISADYLLRDSYAGEIPAQQMEPVQKESRRRGLTAKQSIGFGLFALSLILLFALYLVGILSPHTLYTDHGTYYGFDAYARVYHLEWMLVVPWGMLGLGILLMLWDQIIALPRKWSRKEKPNR